MVESKYSKYSKYYDMRERDATCNTCGKVLKMNKNDTKGLKYHAEKKHNIIFEVKLENDSGFDNQTKKPFKCTELNSLGIECEKRYIKMKINFHQFDEFFFCQFHEFLEFYIYFLFQVYKQY